MHHAHVSYPLSLQNPATGMVRMGDRCANFSLPPRVSCLSHLCAVWAAAGQDGGAGHGADRLLHVVLFQEQRLGSQRIYVRCVHLRGRGCACAGVCVCVCVRVRVGGRQAARNLEQRRRANSSACHHPWPDVQVPRRAAPEPGWLGQGRTRLRGMPGARASSTPGLLRGGDRALSARARGWCRHGTFVQPGPSPSGHPGPTSPGPEVPSWYRRSSTAKKRTFRLAFAGPNA